MLHRLGREWSSVMLLLRVCLEFTYSLKDVCDCLYQRLCSSLCHLQASPVGDRNMRLPQSGIMLLPRVPTLPTYSLSLLFECSKRLHRSATTLLSRVSLGFACQLTVNVLSYLLKGTRNLKSLKKTMSGGLLDWASAWFLGLPELEPWHGYCLGDAGYAGGV